MSSAERAALAIHDLRVVQPFRDHRLVTEPDFRGRYNLYHYLGFRTPAEVARYGKQATRLEYAAGMVLPEVEKEFENTAQEVRLLPVLMEMCGQPYAAHRADKLLEGIYRVANDGSTFLPRALKEQHEGEPMDAYLRSLTPSGMRPGMEEFYRDVFSGRADRKAGPADPKLFLDIYLGKSNELNQYTVGEQADLRMAKPKWIVISPIAGSAVVGAIGLLATAPDVALVLCAPVGGGAGLWMGIQEANRRGADTSRVKEAREKVKAEIAARRDKELPLMPIRAYARARAVFEDNQQDHTRAATQNDFVTIGNLFDPQNTIATKDPILQIVRTEDDRRRQFTGNTYETMPQAVRQELEGEHIAATPGWRQLIAYTSAENTRALHRWEHNDEAITPPMASTVSLRDLGRTLEPWFIQGAKALPPNLYNSTKDQTIHLQFLLPGLGRLLAVKGLETDAAVAKGNFDARFFGEMKDKNWGSTGYVVGWEADQHRKMRDMLDSTVYANFFTGVEDNIGEIPYVAMNGIGRMPAVNEFAATWALSTIPEWQRQSEENVELLARRSPRDVVAAFVVGETAKLLEASIQTMEKARDGNHSLYVQNKDDVTRSLQHQTAVKDRMKTTLNESLFHSAWLKSLLLGDPKRKTVISKTGDKQEVEIPYEHRCLGYLGLVLSREWGESFVEEFTETLDGLRRKNPVWGDKKKQSYDLGFLFALRGLRGEVSRERGVEASDETLEKFSGSIEDLVLSMGDDVVSVQFFHPDLMNDGGSMGNNAAKNKESIGHHAVFLQIAPIVMGSERIVKFADRYMTILNAKRETMDVSHSLTMFGGQTSASYAMEQFKGIGEQNICDRLHQLAEETSDLTEKDTLRAKAQEVRDCVAGRPSRQDAGVIMRRQEEAQEPLRADGTANGDSAEPMNTTILLPPPRHGRRA